MHNNMDIQQCGHIATLLYVHIVVCGRGDMMRSRGAVCRIAADTIYVARVAAVQKRPVHIPPRLALC